MPGCEPWNSERDEDVRRAHSLLERELPAWTEQLKTDGIVCTMTYSDPHYGIFLEFETFENAVVAHEKLSKQADPAHGLRFVRNYSGLSVHAESRSKGPALASLLKQWNISQEQTLVIGDSLNDLCMMNGDYRYRVATVANADPVILAAVEKKKGIIATEKVSKGVVEIFEKLFGTSS
jgi:hydroxymethylpyrimidine pyrophosphatase-like HAD family hydrolase